MSGTEWRFTDEQGVERTLTTQELRASLASGKIAPSTLVWHEGMKDFAPAFTLPELSGAAIAAGRSSRASIPPTGTSSTSTPAAGSPAATSDARPRSVPPPVPKRVPSVAPPVPVGKPHRPPMRTLTGLEPPELLASLGLSGSAGSGIHDEATRDITEDGDEGWDDATDVIPLAPKVPKEAANLPRSIRRIPSIPPPPLPANPTPPPVGAAPAPEPERRPTLMGLAQRKPSKPPPRRSGTPSKGTPAPPPVAGAADPERTVVAPAATAIAAAASALPNPPATGTTTTSRSKPPPPLHRKTTDPGKTPGPPAAGPKRLNKTLEIDTKLTEKALDRAKPQPPSPPKKTEAPAVAAKQEIVPPPADAKLEAASQKAADKKDSVAPAAGAKAPSKFAKDSNTGTITTIRKTAEGTVIMDRPAVKKSAEGTEIMAPRPADISSLDLDDKETAERKPLKRQQTLEMELADHTTASEKHPESPSSIGVSKGKREDTGTTFQVDQEDNPTEELRESSSMPLEPLRKKSALEVPLSSLIAASMVWIIGLLAFFFVGRISGFKSAGSAPVARDGLGDKFLTWAPGPDLGGAFGPGEPKPCSVTRQPKKWAPSASKSVPFDMRAEGEMALLGFAQGDHEGVGLKIDPKTGKFEETFRLKVDSDIVRVAPTGTTDGFFVGVKAEKTIVPASAKSPRFIVIEQGAISAADAPDGSGASSLWTLDGEGEISAETVQRVNDDTFFLTFRRGNEVMGGYFGADKTAKGSLVRVTGSGGKVGKPRGGSNGTEVAVVFADKPAEKEDSHWEIRIGRAAIGQVPETTEEVSIPEGGPGGDVIAPDIIGMSDGRWLLMWTEGQSGERSILAQTYDKHFAPIGDPIALSPPAGSFGQAVLGVVGTYTTVAFLQAADEGFELWGAVLQCGN